MSEEEQSDGLRLKSDYIPKTLDVWALGITIVIGGQYFAWNVGLNAGFGSFLIATLLMGSAYIALVYTIMETTSALPFAGAFGLARCTIGFYAGFMVASIEALEYITYTATSALALSSMIITLNDIDVKYSPLICFLFYFISLVFHIRGGSVFWRFNLILAFISVFFVVIFCFGSLKWVDFSKNAGVFDLSKPDEKLYFVGGGKAFMKAFPLTAWWYIGIESLSFCYNMVKDLHTNIPNGTILCVYTLVITSIFILFVTSSLSPIISVASALSPMDAGNSLIYKFTDNSKALALALPATYATAFGFIFAYGKLICSLSLSKLLPIELSHTTQRNSQPYAAMVAGSIVGYGICLLAFYAPYVGAQLFNICCLSAFTCYISQCIGYCLLSTKFSSLKRKYRSPLGMYGAVYAGLVYLLALIGIIGFQDDHQFAFIVFVCLVALFSLYYLIVSPNQVFCEEEQKVMFNAYVVNANVMKRRKPGSQNTGYLSRAVYSLGVYLGMRERVSTNTNNGANESSKMSSHAASSEGSDSDVHVIQGTQQIVYNVIDARKVSAEAETKIVSNRRTVKDDEKKAFLEDDTPVVAMDDIDGDALDIEAADTYTVPLTNTVGDVMA